MPVIDINADADLWAPLVSNPAAESHYRILPGVTIRALSGPLLQGVGLRFTLENMGALVSNGAEGTGLADAMTFTNHRLASYFNGLSFGPGAASPYALTIGSNGRFVNAGLFDVPGAAGLMISGNGIGYNAGTMTGLNPLTITGNGGALFSNAGSMTSTGSLPSGAAGGAGAALRIADAVGAVFLNTGTLRATGAEAAAVAWVQTGYSSLLQNHGLILSDRYYGISLEYLTAMVSAPTILNRGTIAGEAGSFLGSGFSDQIINRGVMTGDVVMGGGHDSLDNRGGRIEGDWYGGDGHDSTQNAGGVITGNWYGGAGNDSYIETFRGYASSGSVWGTVYGGAGNDTLTAGSNGAWLSGDAGNDRLIGDMADDWLAGGDGDDYIFAYGGNDTADGGRGNDTIYGWFGDDLIYGGDGDDWLSAQEGDDIVWAGAGNDLISGQSGNDTLSGGAGDDTVYGGEGDDRLIAGLGGDLLYGGLGRDVFALEELSRVSTPTGNPPLSFTRIIDFVPGQDLIDLSRIDADSTLAGDQAFSSTFVPRLTGQAGELQIHYLNMYYTTNKMAIIFGDVNGDGRSDFAMAIYNLAAPLIAADFIL